MIRKLPLLIVLILAAFALPVLAQNGPPGGGGQGGQGGGPGGGGGGPGGGGPPDFAEMRQHRLDDIKEDLNVSDDQWKILSPQIEKIMQQHEDVNPHGFGPPGPPPDQQDQQPQSAVQKAMNDLRDALDNNDTKPEDIAAKIDALEKAKAAATADLKKTEDDFKATLTPRQQGILIADGVLD